MTFRVTIGVETEQEVDGRWIAEVPSMPGVMAYGENRTAALQSVAVLAGRVLEALAVGQCIVVDFDG